MDQTNYTPVATAGNKIADIRNSTSSLLDPQTARRRRRREMLRHIGVRLLATGIGIVIGVPLMLYAFFVYQNAFTRASDNHPRDIVISNVTGETATVSWTTDQETQAIIQYGTDPGIMNMFFPENTIGTDHTVVMTDLQPGTAYYFILSIGDEIFDNGGIPWTFTTTGDGGVVPTQNPVQSCPQTDDCELIQERFGRGCETADYVQCLMRREQRSE